MFFLDSHRTRTTYDPNDMEPPRVVKLLALAEEFQALIESGEVRNQADIASLKGLTHACLGPVGARLTA